MEIEILCTAGLVITKIFLKNMIRCKPSVNVDLLGYTQVIDQSGTGCIRKESVKKT